MRIFGRFLYALFAVGIFLLAFSFSTIKMREAYYEDIFGGSLTDEASDLPEFYYFYASFPDYHKSEPVVNIDQSGYQIRAYEIARIIKDDQDEFSSIEEYLFFIVYHEQVGELDKVNTIKLHNNDSGESFDIDLIRYQGLDILSSVNAESSMFLVEKGEIDLENNYNLIQLKDTENNTITESALNLSEEDFTIKDKLTVFYNEYNEFPTYENIHLLEDSSIQPKEQVVTTNNYLVDEYIYIMGIVMGAYFLILIFSTYFIFFKKRKEKRKPYE
ncbi:hypothetical protein KHQ88_07320 [Mycoplasmatota bacterium]|nr:hypothetical protein KHQ88_07320 [Mycoplasmatota bacterium]